MGQYFTMTNTIYLLFGHLNSKLPPPKVMSNKIIHEKCSWNTQCEFMVFLMLQICCDIALNSLQCFSNGPMHTASIFHHEFVDMVILSFYYPFHCMIFCVILYCNWLKLLYVLPFAWFSVCLASSSIHWTISGMS